MTLGREMGNKDEDIAEGFAMINSVIDTLPIESEVYV